MSQNTSITRNVNLITKGNPPAHTTNYLPWNIDRRTDRECDSNMPTHVN